VTADDDRPYVALAVFCERVLEEKEGTLSLIRVVDQITVTTQGADPPAVMPPSPLLLHAVVGLKSGPVHRAVTLQLRHEGPTGIRGELPTTTVLLEGEERGINLNVELAVLATREGLHWFDVLVDGQVLTRMPLRVVYSPVQEPQATDG
jgi:hypothetical protein